MSALISKMLNLVGFDNEEELMDEEVYNSNETQKNQENLKGNYNPFKKNGKVVNLSDANLPVLYLPYDFAAIGNVIIALTGTKINVIRFLPVSETSFIVISFVLIPYTIEVITYIIAIPTAIKIIFPFLSTSDKQ